MLSSDILESQFGPTHLAILSQTAAYRIIQTLAADTGDVLEISLVTFDTDGVGVFPNVHQNVISGGSMGKTFQQAHIPFVRHINLTSQSTVPPIIAAYFRDPEPATIIDVDISVGEHQDHYCHILEIYSPRVVWPLFGDALPLAITHQLNDFAKLLHSLK